MDVDFLFNRGVLYTIGRSETSFQRIEGDAQKRTEWETALRSLGTRMTLNGHSTLLDVKKGRKRFLATNSPKEIRPLNDFPHSDPVLEGRRRKGDASCKFQDDKPVPRTPPALRRKAPSAGNYITGDRLLIFDDGLMGHLNL